jgi:NAD(P)H dehydrogenase (quinone)
MLYGDQVMILLTGAAGKTGQAIFKVLIRKGESVRVFVRNSEQSALLTTLGAVNPVVGDLRSQNDLIKAAEGCESIYFISPNITPDEVVIGGYLLNSARRANTKRFIYHSVLHPQIESMPHHWQKMRFEEKIFESGLDFTILQPCAYMQNILSNWPSIAEKGVYAVPYSTSARLSIVDLEDVAEAAALVLTGTGHSKAIYELAGPESLSQDEVAAIISKVLGNKVTAKTIQRQQWAENARGSSLREAQIETLLKMFEYYEKYGLEGNSKVLEMLINRPAKTFYQFLNRLISNGLIN